MKSATYTIFKAAFVICLSIISFGCSSSSSDTPTATTSVSGVVFAGPASGSSVTVKNSGGVVVAGPVISGADGSYTVSIPNSELSSDLVIETSGGTYTDEATGTTGVQLGTFSAFIEKNSVAAGANVTVDPSSTIIQELVKGGRTKTAAKAVFNDAFGYTPDYTIKPVFACMSSASTTPQRLAGLRAAAFSQLTNSLSIPTAKQHELILALADDLSDGVLDGKKTGGAVVVTTSGTAIPEDIGGRFGQALITFQMDSSKNKSKLTPDKIGDSAFHKVALTSSYKVEYVPVGSTRPTTGKSTFKIKLSNRSDASPATGKTVKVTPFMYMATKSHTSPVDTAITDNGDGTYSCNVYYVMSSAMSGMSMGVWELKVTIDNSESAYFYPVVDMAMGNTPLTKLSGVSDSIMGMAGIEKRTWFLFSEDLVPDMGGTYSFKLFIATKEMMTSFPAVSTNSVLKNENKADWTVNPILVEASTDKNTWVTATETGGGHWTIPGLTGLTNGTAGKIYIRLTVNSEQKTTDGNGVAADGTNSYQTFTVTPGGGMAM